MNLNVRIQVRFSKNNKYDWEFGKENLITTLFKTFEQWKNNRNAYQPTVFNTCQQDKQEDCLILDILDALMLHDYLNTKRRRPSRPTATSNIRYKS